VPSPKLLSHEQLSRALALRDLTDPKHGPHAIQRVLGAAIAALADGWGIPVHVERAPPVVPVEDNYDRLGYPPDGAARDARHTRYVSERLVLRTQTSAMIPPLLRRLSAAPPPDVLLACPGLTWRRDAIDRLHVGEPHQLDLWRVARGRRLGNAELAEMIARVARAVAPGREVRTTPAAHPYTTGGLQLDVRDGARWVEIGECGVAHPAVLAGAGLPPDTTGLAMGLGLDRLVMLAKGLDDIRLLRSEDPRVAGQLLDLAPWRPVSHLPPVRRDLSIAVDADADAEQLGDRVRDALGARAADVEAVEVLAETAGDALPAPARARLGLRAGQKNVLLRLVLRPLGRTLTDAEANALRDEAYAALHEGTVHSWASGYPPAATMPAPEPPT
jgi:phenylalanyl-tRNA synthetase alpha chain